MSEQNDQAKLLLLMAMLALWAAAWGYSVIFGLSVVPEGDGFMRGLNRISGFLGWQGVAGIFAFSCWGVGRGFPAGSGIRRISGVPLGMVLALGAVVLAMGLWALLRQS